MSVDVCMYSCSSLLLYVCRPSILTRALFLFFLFHFFFPFPPNNHITIYMPTCIHIVRCICIFTVLYIYVCYCDTAPPLIKVKAGDSLNLLLKNTMTTPMGNNIHNNYRMPNVTNIHLHGGHISGNSPGDEYVIAYCLLSMYETICVSNLLYIVVLHIILVLVLFILHTYTYTYTHIHKYTAA